MRHRRTLFLAAWLVPVAMVAAWIGISILLTEREIGGYADAIRVIAAATPTPAADAKAMAELPPPVRRYLDYALPNGAPGHRAVAVAAEGEFRRPLTEGFAPTTASQTIAVGQPALVFAATTPIAAGIWARAYDFFANGKMSMRAKIASAITVVNERETEALNRTSLRRWLLESPLYPEALLPGGPVRWQAMDESHARAIVTGFGLEEALVAAFRADGSLASFDAEADGDLTTPYHGSGEHAERSDYRMVSGMMIPHAFEIARAAVGKTYPFWKGHIVSITFE